MNHDDVMMPDFSSVLSEGAGSSHATQPKTVGDEPGRSAPNVSIKIKDLMEDRQSFESESEDELLDASSQDQQESGSELGPRPRIESESSGSEFSESSESDFESESSGSESCESESEEDSAESEDISDDEPRASSHESRRASTEIEIGECDEEAGVAEHVYDEEEEEEEEEEEDEEEDVEEDEEEDEEEHEVCYENTDLGGENVDTASLIAASILAGGGAVRSGTGWTWTSIFIIISAAGGIGIVLLYAINRISELTRLVKTLEENSHMAISERDVQVITTQIIGDMLEDADDSRGQTVETTGQEIQSESNTFVAEENQEVNRQQSVSELLQKDGSEKSEHGENDSVDEHVSDMIGDSEKDEKGEEDTARVGVLDKPLAGEENTAHVDVLDKTPVDVLDKPLAGEENTARVDVFDKTRVDVIDKPLAIVEKEQEIIVDASGAPEKLLIAVDVKQENPVREKPVGEKHVAVAQKTDKEDPDPSVDNLVTMVETMSLSSDPVQTKEPSRLITGAKRVRNF